jgi:hypothetical protein
MTGKPSRRLTYDLTLQPGANDVSRDAPGIYFVR